MMGKCDSFELMDQDISSSSLDFTQVLNRFRENAVVGVLVLVGLGLLGYGVFQFVKPSGPVVEVVTGEESQEEVGRLYVDVSGSVENPGVYELRDGARIGEALTTAGGLSISADRNWVSRFVNLAAPVSDGMKIYIPAEGEGNQGEVAGVQVVGGGEVVGGDVAQGLININTASSSELDSLWGIGQARAGDIIENRPYSNVEELMTKAGIPKNVYDRIKDEVSVY